MTAYVRILLFLTVAVVAVFVAILLVKVVVALAVLAAIVLAALFLYNFLRALIRRMSAPRAVPMLDTQADQAN
jgi:hypothetical protein